VVLASSVGLGEVYCYRLGEALGERLQLVDLAWPVMKA
jgi:hypothetical protein